MKKLLAVFLSLWIAQVGNAALIDPSEYSLTGLAGNFSYGRTNWNAFNEFGALDNVADLANVESLLSDGYTALDASQTGLYNGIYSGYPTAGFHAIEFTLASAYLLDDFAFLSSRSYSALTQVSLEYAFEGSGWQTAVATTSGALGIFSGAANYYHMSFGGVVADAFRITMNGGNQISFHEIQVFGTNSATSVSEPATYFMFMLGLMGLGFLCRKSRT